jgi:hemoglobin
MKNSNSGRAAIVLVVLLALAPLTQAGPEGKASVAEQVDQLQQGCAKTADARAHRHAETPLYERLGGYDRILDLTREIVRLHKKNTAIRHMFEYVDSEALAVNVADFMGSGTGGEARYKGRDLPSAHAHLKLTDADFLAAGGDIVQAMQTKGYGPEEIDEVVCILVSLKDQVVLK